MRKNSYHVHVDPAVMDVLHQLDGVSKKFICDVYETEEWASLPYSSFTQKDKNGKFDVSGKPLGVSPSIQTKTGTTDLMQRSSMVSGCGTRNSRWSPPKP